MFRIQLNKNLEDMNKDERQRLVDLMELQNQEWLEEMPEITAEQSAALRIPNQDKLLKYLKESSKKTKRRLQKWIEVGGSPDDLD